MGSKRQEYQHLAVYSTALQWLYCLLLYCHGFYGKLECGFLDYIDYFPPCLTLMKAYETWKMKYEEVFIDGHSCVELSLTDG